jgi:hypothetical protein
MWFVWLLLGRQKWQLHILECIFTLAFIAYFIDNLILKWPISIKNDKLQVSVRVYYLLNLLSFDKSYNDIRLMNDFIEYNNSDMSRQYI